MTVPTHEELVQRALDLQPALRERAARAEAERRVPAETVRDFQEAGFFKILQPTRWGGYAMHPNTFFDVQVAVATACPSSAWILGVITVHNWQLALFDEQAQVDVWGKDSSVLVSSSYMPVGKVKHTDGGYQLSGEWGFSSGCDHCDWVFLGGFVPPTEEGGRPDMRTFLVPMTDVEIVDDWHVSGLKGTGSKTIIVKDRFVPEHRTHRFSDGFKGSSPGNEGNPEALFKLPFGQIFVRSVSTSAIGMAKGALLAYLDVNTKRIARGDGAKVASDPSKQVVAAEATAVIDELELVLHRNMDELYAHAESGEPILLERRVQFKFESSRVVSRCVKVIDGLLQACGGSAIFLTNPVNRYFQDIHAAAAHYANNPDGPGRNWGSVQLGMKNTDFFI